MPLSDIPLSPYFSTLIKPDSWLAKAWADAQTYNSRPYIGRFAPSPSGFLHQGSLITALASYLHAHLHGGSWLVRMEDVDTSRCTFAYGQSQLHMLKTLGFEFAEPVMWQSKRNTAYQYAFDQLANQQKIYPCTCTRKDLDSQTQHNFDVCQINLKLGKPIRSWRFHTNDTPIVWFNGDQKITDILTMGSSDFVIHRLPNEWTYQLAVVVDDGAQGITHVIRGDDLLDSTARQVALQSALSLPHLIYRHVPLLLDDDGRKLSKSEQAPSLSILDGPESLMHAWCFLGGRNFAAPSVNAFWQAVLMARI